MSRNCSIFERLYARPDAVAADDLDTAVALYDDASRKVDGVPFERNSKPRRGGVVGSCRHGDDSGQKGRCSTDVGRGVESRVEKKVVELHVGEEAEEKRVRELSVR